MKQRPLFTKPRKTVARRRSIYDQQNQNAADIILGDVESFGGEDSLIVCWARLVKGKFMEGENERSEDGTTTG